MKVRGYSICTHSGGGEGRGERDSFILVTSEEQTLVPMFSASTHSIAFNVQASLSVRETVPSSFLTSLNWGVRSLAPAGCLGRKQVLLEQDV